MVLLLVRLAVASFCDSRLGVLFVRVGASGDIAEYTRPSGIGFSSNDAASARPTPGRNHWLTSPLHIT